MRENWWLFGGFIVFAIGMAVLVGHFLEEPYLRGLVLGAFLVAAPTAVWVFAMQNTSTAPVMMGEIAEQWTAQELRRLVRRGKAWRLVNHFALRVDDIDHVLIGPAGAYAVETKWSGPSWTSEIGRARERESIDQARSNARSLRLWNQFKNRGIPVTAVVVLWGRGLKAWPADQQVRQVDDVHVVAGPALRRWLESIQGDVVDATTVAEAWKALDAQVARRDPIDAERHPIPTSLAEWAGLSGAGIAGAAFGSVALGRVLDVVGNQWIVLPMTLALGLVAGLVARRSTSRVVTWIAGGWCGAMLLLLVAALVLTVAARV